MKIELLKRYLKVITSYVSGYPLYAPDSVSVIVTDKCNLRCIMCDFWRSSKNNNYGISLNEFKELFMDLRSLGTKTVQLTGGEPFLRKDIIEILRLAKANGLGTTVVTNGTLLTENNVSEFAQNTNLVYISLDAPTKNQHENIRGVANIFERIISSIKLLVNEIKVNSYSTKVMICTTITPKGIHDPAKMVSLAKELGVNGIIYNPASSIDYGYTVLKSEGCFPNSTYSVMIDKIIALMSNSKNIIRSNPFYLAASKEFLNGNERYYKFPCYAGGYNGPLIAFDGTVFPCCAWNLQLGNIKEQPFSKIWKSEWAKEVRLKIKRRQCPVCQHHTRTFDFILRAPFLFRDSGMLLKHYKTLSKI